MASPPDQRSIEDNVHFFKPSLFPWIKNLVSNLTTIQSELLKILPSPDAIPSKKEGDFSSTAEESTDGPALITGSRNWCGADDFNEFWGDDEKAAGWVQWWNGDAPAKNENEHWTVFGLLSEFGSIEKNVARCPLTTELIRQVPNVRVAGFSRIRAGAALEPHCGFTGESYGALAFHMGLLIPPNGCGLQCGSLVHEWKRAGDVIVFDDTYTHWAWNNSDFERVVLYIDFKTDIWNELGY